MAAAKTKPLASEPDGQPGPAAPPGEYEVELSVGPETQSARFTIAGDPRLGTTPEEYASQFALLQQLTQSLSRLNEAVNRIRRIKLQLAALAARADGGLADQAKAAMERLEAVEAVLVDVNRASPRDVLRHPAGLNDTLGDLLSGVGIADAAPTAPHVAVSQDIMARVDAEIAKVDALAAGEIAEVNRLAGGLEHVSG